MITCFGLSGVMIALLAVAVVLPGLEPPLQLSSATGPAAADFAAAVARVPQGGSVLVDVEADLGTYPEIRYVTRAALADLLRHGASLAFVSFSPEGRAIGLAELERLRDEGIGAHRLLDLGYVAGAEAGVVLSVTRLVPDGLADQGRREIRHTASVYGWTFLSL